MPQLGKSTADLDLLTGGTERKIQLDTSLAAAYSAGLVSWDTVRKTLLVDTGYTDGTNVVRQSVGMESYIPIFNDTGGTISNGKVVNGQGFDATNAVLKGILAKADNPATSSVILGIATHDIADQTVGLVTAFGEVNDIDTSSFTGAGPIYVSDTTAGDLTQIRPRFPSNIVIVGSVTKVDASVGKIFVKPSLFSRFSALKDYHITTGPATTHYVAGFYDWDSAGVTLTQASLTHTHGTAGEARAAHAGAVFEAAGTCPDGKVGLRVQGTVDDEEGTQTASQYGIITTDITTVTADQMLETSEKFSGQVTYELYVTEGSPTTYSLTFNHGFSKYEDMANRDFTIQNFEAVWEGGSTDSGMDIVVLHHKETGWSYSLAGFTAGNGYVVKRSIDQAVDGDVENNTYGAYKRVNVNQFIEGSASEGIVIQVKTTSINSIADMGIHVLAYSEELTR
jgi:hypothetical protein